MESPADFPVSPELDGQTVAAALRRLLPDTSWAQAKRLITTRRVAVNQVLCLNDARRLKAGEVLRVHPHPQQPVPREADVRLLHIDADLVVVDKPAGVQTLRRDDEAGFTDDRKALAPTLDELVPRLLPGRPAPQRPGRPRSKRAPAPPGLYAVHRLDRDTSGLMLFALSVRARDRLIAMFSKHEVRRSYRGVCLGILDGPRTLDTCLVRNRGDGLRGSVPSPEGHPDAKRAVTHLRPLETIGGACTLLDIRLETGRTHQIRIHLAEIGHMLCGEKLYTRPAPGAPAMSDPTAAPRQALHSAQLELIHPVTGQPLSFSSPLPRDLATWLERLRSPQP